jgi:hypothetical protein
MHTDAPAARLLRGWGRLRPVARRVVGCLGQRLQSSWCRPCSKLVMRVRALPSRIQAVISWSQDDTASIEEALGERAANRAEGEFR